MPPKPGSVATASQTIGPFWHLLEDKSWADLTRFGAEGERVTLLGRVLDGDGRVFTDEHGRYKFLTIRPGAYPWPNHKNAWRPNHIHFSYFGPAFATRLVTQMYFPGDPLLALDPIFHAVPDEAARNRLVAKFDMDLTEADWALGYRFDVVLRGRDATPMEH